MNYQKDVKTLKENTKKRLEMVLSLIEFKKSTIQKIKDEAEKIAVDEKEYKVKIEQLNRNKAYLDKLIDRISYTKI